MNPPEEGCLCGYDGCSGDHPDEAEFVKLAKKEAPGIIKRLKAGLKPEPLDLTLLRMAGRKVLGWRRSKKGKKQS